MKLIAIGQYLNFRLNVTREPRINIYWLFCATETRFKEQAAVKLPGSSLPARACQTVRWHTCFQSEGGRDSGTALIHSCRPTINGRGYATLRRSQLPPLLTRAYRDYRSNPISPTGTEQDSETVHTVSGLRFPMFLLNSRDPLVSARQGPRFSSPRLCPRHRPKPRR